MDGQSGAGQLANGARAGAAAERNPAREPPTSRARSGQPARRGPRGRSPSGAGWRTCATAVSTGSCTRYFRARLTTTAAQRDPRRRARVKGACTPRQHHAWLAAAWEPGWRDGARCATKAALHQRTPRRPVKRGMEQRTCCGHALRHLRGRGQDVGQPLAAPQAHAHLRGAARRGARSARLGGPTCMARVAVTAADRWRGHPIRARSTARGPCMHSAACGRE